VGVFNQIKQSRTVHMTQKGYSFLLSDLQVQLWTFVAQYVHSATTASASVTSAAVLAFLFQMGFCKSGSVYSTHALSSTEHVILHDLAAFGLIYVTPDGSSFTPTSLAMRLVAARASAATAIAGQSKDDLSLSAAHMSVIVERNMRVYMYTSSPLAVDLLRIFAKVDAVMPNVVSATLTKGSVGAALDMGLTAAEVVHFLQCRLHQRMVRDGLRVPENVSDALHAWEEERQRATMTQAVQLEAFDSAAEYEDLVDFLHPEEVLFSLEAEAEQVVVVRMEALKRIGPFLRERRAQIAD
jgi:transcription initiation factor TFIIH subunit 4